MSQNQLLSLWEHRRRNPQAIDLIDGSFHNAGLILGREVLERGFSQWLDQRRYAPDPQGRKDSRKALVEFYKSWDFSTSERDWFLTSGTSESYALLFRTFTKPGDKILLPRPGYPLFEQLCLHHHLTVVFYDLDPEAGYQIPRENLETVWTNGIKFIVLISPSNPTGQVLNEASVITTLDFAYSKGIPVICDEVFDSFLYDQVPMVHPGAQDTQGLVFTLNGVSKMFGAPDLKLGWIGLIGNPQKVNSAREELILSADAYLSAGDFPQFILPELFSNGNLIRQPIIQLLQANREVLKSFKQVMEPWLQVILPAGGIHIPIQVRNTMLDDETCAFEILKNQNVLVHPGYFYEFPEKPPHLVLSLLQDSQKFIQGLERLSAFFQGLNL